MASVEGGVRTKAGGMTLCSGKNSTSVVSVEATATGQNSISVVGMVVMMIVVVFV